VTDGQTDRQRDIPTMACIASYADAL